MKTGKKGNCFIIIEAGRVLTYNLDDKDIWKIGRYSTESSPDMELVTKTISRDHGRFQNMDGIWFYFDCYGTNGTAINGKVLTRASNGRAKPILLNDGDTFVFGGGPKGILNKNSVFGVYFTKIFEENWSLCKTEGYNTLRITADGKTELISSLRRGMVIEKETGMAIYLGNETYILGDIEVSGINEHTEE